MLRLHGLRLHTATIPAEGTGKVQKKVDVAFYKATLQNIKLVHLHDSLHQPIAETLPLRGLCLHDRDRFLQTMSDLNLNEISKIVAEQTKVVPSRIPVAITKVSVRSATPTYPVSLRGYMVALSEALASFMWFHNGHRNEHPKLSRDFERDQKERK
ncbi:hypothetical protein NHQ30_002591 [Ciborinia camelliae]|nr:hypothetical protein NHQ30_002591 [Ciborinia camelliae]